MNDLVDIFPARVRGLQAIYPEAHKALVNWGLWSRDRAGFQRGLTRSQIYNEYRWNEEDDGYASEGSLVIVQTEAPAKAEKIQDEPYDEKAGVVLDERIHGPGGLACHARPILKIAYVDRDVPEYQYPYKAGLLPDHVLERLELGLRFVARFA